MTRAQAIEKLATEFKISPARAAVALDWANTIMREPEDNLFDAYELARNHLNETLVLYWK